MAFEVRVPAVGESVQEGEIYKWHKQNGDYVELDDVLVELETDKATVEIVAEAAGVVTLKKEEGETVVVGDLLAEIDTTAQKSAAPAQEAPAAKAPKDLLHKLRLLQAQLLQIQDRRVLPFKEW